MELIKVKDAKYINGYKIDITFNNEHSFIVDLEEKMCNDHRAIFKELQDIDTFKNFTQNRWTIEWPNGADLAPEFLYDLAQKQAEEEKKATGS
jgi:hypothetical protein